jgi:hypothetical protein
LKDESNPVQVKHAVGGTLPVDALKKRVDAIPDGGTKNMVTPKIGHRLHRLTTMTSKTAQFHLLAHGNPKPDNLLLSPLVQLNEDGTPREEAKAEAAAIGVGDRAHIGVNN